MRKYLIDVNIISYLADRESPFHEAVRRQFRSLRQEDIAALSILGLYELYYSLSKAGDALDQDILRMKEKVCAHLPIIPLTENGAKIFAEIKSRYQAAYRLPKTALARDTVDLMLASSAVDAGYILVSHDQVFRKIQSLEARFQTVDWAL